MSPQSSATATARPHTRLPTVLIAVLLVWAVADIIGRLGPVEWLGILPELVAARHNGFYNPFQPNIVIRNSSWIGETAVTGNLPSAESRAPITFSTDDLGFRLTPGLSAAPKLDLLLTGGASFAYGGGLSDDETFPAVLTRDHHLTTYNAGRFFWDSTHFTYVQHLIDRFGPRKPAAVVYLYWETANPPLAVSQMDALPWKLDRAGGMLLGPSRYQEIREDLQNERRQLSARLSVSPMEVFSTRFFKMLAIGRFLPNPYASAVESRTLPNGQRILFLDRELARVTMPVTDAFVRSQAEFFQEYARRLSWSGVRLYVVLLPSKYSLYGPFTQGYTEPRFPLYLGLMEAELNRRHIHVMNGLTVLAPFAARDVESRSYSYYRDDHHWTPEGVRRLAAAFAGFVRNSAGRER